MSSKWKYFEIGKANWQDTRFYRGNDERAEFLTRRVEGWRWVLSCFDDVRELREYTANVAYCRPLTIRDLPVAARFAKSDRAVL